MKKKLKYYLFCLIGYSPIIIGVLIMLYVWFIRLPFKSTYYYYNTLIFCNTCEVELGSDEKYCPVCSKSIEEIAILSTYKHCDYCESNELYKNSDIGFCKNCGKELAEEKTVFLNEIGFSTIKEFRNALMLDNLQRLLSNKIMTTFIVLIITIITKNFVYQAMFRAAKRKILRDGLRKKNEIR